MFRQERPAQERGLGSIWVIPALVRMVVKLMRWVTPMKKHLLIPSVVTPKHRVVRMGIHVVWQQAMLNTLLALLAIFIAIKLLKVCGEIEE